MPRIRKELKNGFRGSVQENEVTLVTILEIGPVRPRKPFSLVQDVFLESRWFPTKFSLFIRTYQETENVRTTDLDVMVAVGGVQEEETGYNTLTYVILKYFLVWGWSRDVQDEESNLIIEDKTLKKLRQWIIIARQEVVLSPPSFELDACSVAPSAVSFISSSAD